MLSIWKSAPVSISHPRKKSTRNNQTGTSYRPTLELLEERITPYVLSGYSWLNTNISASFMPDGALDMGYQSDLFSLYNASYPTGTWQLQFARALQTWADASALNFHFVTEQIDPTTGLGFSSGTSGLAQGDPRFGDIRLGASPGLWGLGHAIFPGGSTSGGDITLNGSGAAYIGSNPDLYSILLHEAGAALGLGEGSATTSVMNGPGPYSGLYADDIAGIQALYGNRHPDNYDAVAPNDSLATATLLTLSSGAGTFNADISSMTDVDNYCVTAPADSDALIVSVDARDLSLFDPKIAVYDMSGKLLGTANANTYGSVATIGLTGLVGGQSYFLQVQGATSDVFGMGAYQLNVQFASGISNVNAPSDLTATPMGGPQVTLNWTNNAADATANVVERSNDGVNWTQRVTLAPESTSYVDTSVADGATLYYQVHAVNGVFSSQSDQIVVTLAPLAPGGLTASVASSKQINLAWSDVAGETGFTVRRSLDGATWTEIATTAGGITSYQDRGLTGSTTYQYEVCASNAGGASSYSSPVNATTVAAAPTVCPVSTSQIDIVWNAVTGATGYKIDRSRNGVTNWVRIAATSATVTHYRNSGLAVGTTYSYCVRAINTVGLSAPSDPASATTLKAPYPPTGLSAKTISRSQINLAWNSAVGVAGYRIERSSDNVNWVLIGTTLGSVTKIQSAGLSAGHTYFYRVRACASGRISAPSDAVSASTIPPAPSGLVATTRSANQVTLVWKDVTGETGFLIERSQDGVHWVSLGSTEANVTSFEDSDLLPATRYVYRVRASNSGGISSASNLAAAITNSD